MSISLNAGLKTARSHKEEIMFKTTRFSRSSGMLAAASLTLMLAAPPLIAAVSNWSPRTSEEFPPLTARNGQLVSGMYCGGSYCDNIYLGYQSVPGVNFTTNAWTSYFSEEGTNFRVCSGNAYVTGLSCRGSYCDNISLQCTTVSGRNRGSCYWTPYFSEEAGYNYLPDGYYAAGVRCTGSYCDNKSIYACR